jgi:hypothetical protein
LAAIDYTTTQLIVNLKRRAMVPTAQNLFSTQDFLDVLNETLKETIIPTVKSVNEEYFVTYTDTAFVSGTAAYDIPSAALGGALRNVTTVDSSGEESKLSRIEPETLGSGLRPNGFYVQDNQVVVYPTPTQAGTLRMRYERRTNELVATSSAGQVSVVGATTVTLSTIPSSWTTSTKVDAIAATPHFKLLGSNVTITNIASTVLTLSVPSGLAIGDWICPTGQSVIPQIPVEAQPLLCQAAALRCLKNMSDEAAQREKDTYAEMKADFLKLITPRVEGEARKVNNSSGVWAYAGRGRGW